MRFLTLGYFLGSISLALLSALYGYIVTGSIEFEYLYVPFKFMFVQLVISLSIASFCFRLNNKFQFDFRLPWNQHTVRGWIYETVFSVISSSLYLFTNVVFLTFFIGICEFHRGFLNYFDVLVTRIKNGSDNQNIKTLLCDTITYHIAIKR